MQRVPIIERARFKGISIHAPYKGCNLVSELVGVIRRISIHAPYKGCNFVEFFNINWLNYFNPCTL